MARRHSTSFALTNGAATDEATPWATVRKHRIDAAQRDKARREVPGIIAFTVTIPQRGPDGARRVGQVQA